MVTTYESLDKLLLVVRCEASTVCSDYISLISPFVPFDSEGDASHVTSTVDSTHDKGNNDSNELASSSISSAASLSRFSSLTSAKDKRQSPVQTTIEFPKSDFGKVIQSFQQRWYRIYPWLESSINFDAAFCYACRQFHTNPETTFTMVGFKDWKHALGKRVLILHSSTKTHIETILNWKEYQKRV